MEKLPQELIDFVLEETIRLSASDKKHILNLRGVCKSFNAAIVPFAFRMLQIDLDLLQREGSIEHLYGVLPTVGERCETLYIDMSTMMDTGMHPLTASASYYSCRPQAYSHC